MSAPTPPHPESVRAAEVAAALSLATDLGMGLPFEHGLRSTLVAMRLADRLGADDATARQVYYGCLLCYIGCTADADVSAALFEENALVTHFGPVMFGTPAQTMVGVMRALAGSEGSAATRAYRAVSRLPRAVRSHRGHLVAVCEVAQMLTARLGLPPDVCGVFASLTERWDGKGQPMGLKGDRIPYAVRVAQVAQDAVFHCDRGGAAHAARVIGERSGRAFDPAVAAALTDAPVGMLSADGTASAWEATLAREPEPRVILHGDQIDRSLAALGDFGDLLSPFLTGHSSGVADLVGRAARQAGLTGSAATAVRRAAYLHDIGRVAVAAHIWQKPAPLTSDEHERVRLHAYYTERVLNRSSFLAPLAPLATAHHERLDGSGYHRGVDAATLSPAARMLAAADAYQAMISPRPHRDALPPESAARALRDEARAGRLDADGVNAVLTAAGHPARPVPRPSGLTEREAQVLGLLAHGRPTKQIARALGISVKTADHHVQNVYAKIGVSSRAAATLYAMQHGLAAPGELPMAGPGRPS